MITRLVQILYACLPACLVVVVVVVGWLVFLHIFVLHTTTIKEKCGGKRGKGKKDDDEDESQNL